MDFDFTKAGYDADLDEIEDADELRGIVREFESAQEANISEFEDAKDTLEDFEGRIGEAQEFKQDLAESLSEVSPLSEEEALTYDMARIRELIGEFSDDADDADEPDEEAAETFSNMGQRGETHSEDDAGKAFAEEHLGDIGGLNF